VLSVAEYSCFASMVNLINFLICVSVGKLLKFYHCSYKNCSKRSLSRSCWNSLTFFCWSQARSFEQDRALAHRNCKMVKFLTRETPDFKPPCCLMLTR